MPGQQMPGQQPSSFANFQAPAFGQATAAPRRSGGGMNKGLLIGLIAGGGVVLSAVIALVVWLLLSGGGGNAAAADLAYLPDNCFMYGKVRMSEVMKTAAWKQLVANTPALQNNFHPESIDYVAFGMVRPAGPGKQPEFTAVIRAAPGKKLDEFEQPSSPAEREETIAGRKVTVMQVQNQTLATCMIDDDIGLVGTLNAVRAVLERDGDATIPADLKAVMDQTDFSQHIALAFVTTGLESLTQNNVGGGGVQIPGFDPQELLKNIKGVILQGNVSSDVQLSAKAICTDEQTAKKIEIFIDTLLKFAEVAAAQNPQAKQVLDSLKVESSGHTVSLSITIPAQLLAQAQSNSPFGGNRPAPKGFPGGNPGFPGTRP